MTRIPTCLAVLLSALTACSTDPASTPTQVMVVISAAPAVIDMTRELHVVVRSGQGEEPKWEERLDRTVAMDTEDTWPLEVSITPKGGDATRIYEVTATALDGADVEIARVRAISGFVEGKALQLSLVFDEACLGKVSACNENQTCIAGKCEDARVDRSLLTRYNPDHNPDHSAGQDATVPSVDGGAAKDAGTTLTDSSVALDSGGPSVDSAVVEGGADSGGSGFPEVPNFDIGSVDFASAPSTTVDCGDITVDTTGPTLTGWCGKAPAPVVLAQAGGPAIVVIPLSGLNLPSGRVLRAQGTLPLALVVDGDAVIDGVIDVSAVMGVPGPGGNMSCTVGSATAPMPPCTPRGGGGGGFGTRGGRSCASTPNEGQAEGTADLVPLRGGCPGYSVAACSEAGAGGGAVELIVSGTLSGAGEIRANGGVGGASCTGYNYSSGGGSGGAIFVLPRAYGDTLTLSVNGGNGGDVPGATPACLGANGLGITDPANVAVADTSWAGCTPGQDCNIMCGGGGGYGRMKVW